MHNDLLCSGGCIQTAKWKNVREAVYKVPAEKRKTVRGSSTRWYSITLPILRPLTGGLSGGIGQKYARQGQVEIDLAVALLISTEEGEGEDEVPSSRRISCNVPQYAAVSN
jgi:hypothetical protein